MKRHLTDLRAALRQVFTGRLYIALACALTIVALLLAVWFPNLGLIGAVFSASDVPFIDKLAVALSLLGGIATNFSLLTAGYTITIAGLFGLCTAMIIYLFQQKRAAAAGRNMAVGAGGVASGVMGIGCAACGSLVLGGALPFAGATAALAALPLGGAEFGIVSVVLLLLSLLLVSRSITQPAGCALPRTTEPRQE